MNDDVLTRNENSELAVRTVSATETSTVVNPNDVYTRDSDGNLAVRVVGSGGGDQHNLGYFATPEALRTAHPTAEAGDWAIVGSTDTVWIWDTDNSEWKDSDTKGQVTSVNNQTGAVTLTATDVGALASGDNISSLVNDAGYLTQHQSIKTVNNTSLVGTGNIDVQEPLVSGTNIKTINGNSVLGSGNIETEVIQYASMPVASEEYADKIVQYVGSTDSTYTNGYFYACGATYSDASATISQTIGSGLTDLSINVETFETAEQPTQSGNTNFVASIQEPSVNFTTQVGNIVITGTYSGLRQILIDEGYDFEGEDRFLNAYFVVADVGEDPLIRISNLPDPTVVGWVNKYVSQLNAYGFSITGTPAIGDYASYVANRGGLIWSKNGTTVDIAEYGISYSGTPNNNDTLTVAYLAPSLIGYSWEQKNVQPEPTKGIEWVATVDLPANSGLGRSAYPIYTIEGGLPDGTYEFYWQVMGFCQTTYSLPAMPVTYKARFTITDNQQYCNGSFMPVISDDYFTNQNSILQDWSWYDVFKKSGNNWLLYSPDASFWCTSLAWQVPDASVPECFKISAIVNVDTGEKIIPTGELTTGSEPSYESTVWGGLTTVKLTPDPFIPTYFISSSIDYDDNTQYIRIRNYGISTDLAQGDCSELDVAMESSLGGRYHVIVENGVNTYTATVLEASGDLANVQIGYVGNEVFVYLNTASGTTATVKGNVGIKGASRDTPSFYPVVPSSSFTPINITEVGGTIMPNVLGKILQYNGTTTASYTNGYFYKANGTIVTTPQSCTATNISPDTVSITIDTNNFVAALATATGHPQSIITDRLKDNHQWNIGTDENGDISYLYWEWFGNFYAGSGVIESITLTNSSANIFINFNIAYTPATQSVQNQSWDLVNVQPTYTAPATMPTLAVADWNNNTQTVNVTGVTATNAVIISPAPASATEYASCGVLCTAQGSGTLTFTCQTTPTNALAVNVIIL